MASCSPMATWSMKYCSLPSTSAGTKLPHKVGRERIEYQYSMQYLHSGLIPGSGYVTTGGREGRRTGFSIDEKKCSLES